MGVAARKWTESEAFRGFGAISQTSSNFWVKSLLILAFQNVSVNQNHWNPHKDDE